MYFFNKEMYPDLTAYEALSRIEREVGGFWPLVYVCSPFRGDEELNQEKARAYSRFAVEHHCLPIAPHLLFPQFLCDRNAAERLVAMKLNDILLGKCHELWVFGDKVTDGMAKEIHDAKRYGKRIRYFKENFQEVQHV